jgi:hypothetical protein
MNSQASQWISDHSSIKSGDLSARRSRRPFVWIGAGALIAGVAFAGSGTAYADTTPSSNATSTRHGSPHSNIMRWTGLVITTIKYNSGHTSRPPRVPTGSNTVVGGGKPILLMPLGGSCWSCDPAPWP